MISRRTAARLWPLAAWALCLGLPTVARAQPGGLDGAVALDASVPPGNVDGSVPVPLDGSVPPVDLDGGGPASDGGAPASDGGTAGGSTTPTAAATAQEVTIWWKTAEAGTTEVHYGPTSQPSAASYPLRSAAAASLGTQHSHTLRSLAPGTWYFRTRSATSGGAIAESPEGVFVVPPRDLTQPLDSLAPDGPVLALAQQGTRVYVGGRFSQVGRVHGAGVPLGAAGALAQPGFPMVAGTVYAATPDGAGGLFIAGNFRRVGGLPRQNAAHLLQDLGVDPAWAPAVDGPVYALAATGAGVYLGGQFGRVNGAARAGAAAVDRAAGTTTLAWDPRPDGPVRALAGDPGGLYLGGAFGTLQGQPRGLLARVDAATGAPHPWKADLSGGLGAVVLALALDGTTLYVGGSFTRVATSTGPALARQNLVALDTQTAAPAISFTSETDGPVTSIAVGLGRVCVGGLFTGVASSYGGPTMLRPYLAAFDAQLGTLLGWSPAPDGPVTALAVAQGALLAGGAFTSVGGARRDHAAAFDASGTLTGWSPRLDGAALAFGQATSAVFVGGDFDQAEAGTARPGLAAFELAGGTPALLPWTPQLAGEVRALLLDGTTLYVGGVLGGGGSTVPQNLVAVSTDTGLPVPGFSPPVNGPVSALAKVGTTLLFGGEFNRAANAQFDYLGGVDVGTGALATLPAPNLPVSALAAAGQRLYLGGSFTAVAGVTRGHAARLDFTDGGTALLGWAPALNGPVGALAATDAVAYVGGGFTAQGGLTAYGAAVDAASGAPAAGWSHGFDGWVGSLLVAGPIVYFGGGFTQVDGAPALHLAAFGTGAGAPRAWAPDFEGQGEVLVRGISTDCPTGTAAFGGQFSGSQRLLTGPLAFFRLPAGCTGGVPPSVTTLPADQVTATAAALGAEVLPNDPNGAGVWLRYDTRPPAACDDTFGTRLPPSGVLPASSAVANRWQALATGLSPSTTYFYCALAKNGVATGFGGLVPFTTPASADGGVGAPQLTSAPLTAAQCGVEYTLRPSAQGDPVLSWSAPTAPGGLAVDPATGLVRWTPLPGQKGPAAVVLRVQNGAGAAEQAFTIEVSCPGEVTLGTGCQCGSAGDLWGVAAAAGAFALRRRRRPAAPPRVTAAG